jgi:hypothetical protein
MISFPLSVASYHVLFFFLQCLFLVHVSSCLVGLVWLGLAGGGLGQLYNGGMQAGHAVWVLVPPALGHDLACQLWDKTLNRVKAFASRYLFILQFMDLLLHYTDRKLN